MSVLSVGCLDNATKLKRDELVMEQGKDVEVTALIIHYVKESVGGKACVGMLRGTAGLVWSVCQGRVLVGLYVRQTGWRAIPHSAWAWTSCSYLY